MRLASNSCGKRVELPHRTMSGPLPALTFFNSSMLRSWWLLAQAKVRAACHHVLVGLGDTGSDGIVRRNMRPMAGPDVVRLAPEQHVIWLGERADHPHYGGPGFLIRVFHGPSAKIEPAARIFRRAARTLHDAIERNKCKGNDLSHFRLLVPDVIPDLSHDFILEGREAEVFSPYMAEAFETLSIGTGGLQRLL